MEKPKYRKFRRPVQRIDVHCHLGNGANCISSEERMAVDKVLGVDHCVILPGPINGEQNILPGTVDTAQARELAQRFPDRFSWFCNVEPDGTEKTRTILGEAKKNGALGVGEFGTLLPFDDPRVDHLLFCCGEWGLPFLFHISPYGTNAYGVIDEKGLPGLEGALQRHPDTIFIAHSQPFWYELGTYDPSLPGGALNGFPFGPVQKEGRAVELLRRYPNLYADLSAISGSNAILRDWPFGLGFLREFQDRLLFGTDLVETNFIYPLGQMLDYALLSGQLDEAAYKKICRGNAIRVLNMDLES